VSWIKDKDKMNFMGGNSGCLGDIGWVPWRYLRGALEIFEGCPV